jgi:RimJ/RimL family protein N-acetyltransferase
MSTNDEAPPARSLASRLGRQLSGYGVELSLTTDADAVEIAAVAAATPDDAFRWTFVDRDAAGVRERLAWFAETNRLIYVVRVDGRVVGQTGFYDLDFFYGRDEPDGVEVGHTWYVPGVRGTTVNPACKLLLFTHAFETWGVVRIAMRTDARNAASRAAMLKLGMTYEGVRRRHMVGSTGHLRDSAYFSAVAEEWPQIKQRLLTRLAR